MVCLFDTLQLLTKVCDTQGTDTQGVVDITTSLTAGIFTGAIIGTSLTIIIFISTMVLAMKYRKRNRKMTLSSTDTYVHRTPN